KNGDVFARVRQVTVSDQNPHFSYGAPDEVHLADVEAVFIRKDPPFDVGYLYMTLLLERARGGTLIVNDPRGLRDANEKIYGQHFARHMPRTLVSPSAEQTFAFTREVGGRSVIKPLYGAGGAGVMMLATGDKNGKSIVELLTKEGQHIVMVQEYLPAVEKGDKRVLVLDGELLGAGNRGPPAGDLRANSPLR